jgi:hypothetical protein
MAIYKVASAEQSLSGITPPSPYFYSSLTGVNTSNSQLYSIKKIVVDSSKNIFVVYQRNDSNGGALAKYDQYGSLIWVNGYKDNQSYYDMSGLAIDSSGNIYLGGGTYQSFYNRPHVMKLNSSGSIIWQKHFGSASSNNGGQINDLAIDSSGNIYGVGAGRSGADNSKPYIIKIDTNGSRLWEYYYNVSNDGIFYNAKVDSSGNIWAAGYAYSGGNTNANGFFAKLDSSGSQLFQRTLSEGTNMGQSIERGNLALDSSDNAYVAIQTTQTSGALRNTVIFKYNSSGTIQWQRRLSFSGGDTQPNGIAIAADGNIVTGNSVGNVGQVVVGHNPSGTIQWQRRVVLSNGSLNTAMEYFTADSFGNMYFGVQTGGLSSSGGSENGIIKIPSDGTGSYSTALLKMGMQYISSSLTDASSSVTSTASTDSLTSLTLTAGNSSSAIYTINNSLSKAVL